MAELAAPGEEWRTAAGWAAEAKAIGIDPRIMPNTDRCVRSKAARESWPSRPRAGAGGGVEYPLSALPEAFQVALRGYRARRELREATAVALVEDLPAAEDLKTYQRGAMEARAILLAEIDRLVLTGLSQGKAIATLLDLAAKRELAPVLQRAVAAANARGNATRMLARATVYNWLKARGQAGGNVVALAPTAKPEGEIPIWAPTFMARYCQPQKPSIPMVLEDWPAGEVKPSVDQVRRFLRRVDAVSRNAGRIGPRDLRKLRAYVARDTAELWPGAIFCGDGHTFKAEVAHPIHGQPFRPEVTMMVDVFTRRIVGWSVALAENTSSVADALRHAVTAATACDILYYDNGAGAKNATWDDPTTGLAARLGIGKMHSRAYNSQARGVVERRNSTVLHRAAKKLPTYVGQDMDREARQRAFKITRREIRKVGASPLLPNWAEFVALLDAEITAANARECEGLPRIADEAAGRRRHMSPDEMWAKAIAEGWRPDPIPAEVARDLFRPVETRTAKRAIVELFGNEYYGGAALEALHGETVQVAYDIHDASKVWVRDREGRFVCEAIWGGHKTSFVPVEKIRLDHEKRVAGMKKRAQVHVAQAEAELRAPLIEHQPAEALHFPTVVNEPVPVPVLTEAILPSPIPARADGRPLFGNDVEKAKWLVGNPAQVSGGDREWLRQQLRSHHFLTLTEWEGIAATTLHDLAQHKSQTKAA